MQLWRTCNWDRSGSTQVNSRLESTEVDSSGYDEPEEVEEHDQSSGKSSKDFEFEFP